MIKCYTCFTDMISYSKEGNTIKCKCPKCGSEATVLLNDYSYINHVEWTSNNNIASDEEIIQFDSYPYCNKKTGDCGVRCISYIRGKCTRIGGVCNE